VARVVDGDTLILDGGLSVRLAAVTAPKPQLGQPSAAGGAEAARAALAGLVGGRPVRLRYYGPADRDRYGRAIAEVFLAEGDVWVEAELVRLGWARVLPGPDEGGCAATLFPAEQEARKDARGLWADSVAVRPSDDAALLTERDSYQIVQGRVTSVHRAGKLTYVNFGRDHKASLTVTLQTSDEKRFAGVGKSPDALVGQRVEVRGWIDDHGGPTIAVDHPDEIVVLGR
jgi:micrococcal nuclease